MSKETEEWMVTVSHQIENTKEGDKNYRKESNRKYEVENYKECNEKFPKGAQWQIWAGSIENQRTERWLVYW